MPSITSHIEQICENRGLEAALQEALAVIRRQAAVSTPPATAQPVTPVVDVLLDVMPYVVGLAAVLMIASFLLRAMRPAPQASPFSSGGGYYSAAQPSAGGGSGIGVGTAAAGGFVAGMVAEHFLHGRDQEKPHESVQPRQGGSNSTGWIDSSPSSAGDTLANRPIDFGSGDGWGGNEGGGASSDDASW